MANQFSNQQPQIKTRTSVLVFLKGATAPLVLYLEHPQETYEELLNTVKSNINIAKLVEKETQGPIKKVAFFTNQVAAVALQDEQYLQQ